MQKRKSRLTQIANKVLGYVAPADHEDRARIDDCSHWCGPIEWPLFESDGIILKASEGETWRDPAFKDSVTGFVAQDWELDPILGSYHFWREQYTAKANALNYWNTINEIATIVKIEPFILMDVLSLDVEGGKHSNNPLFTYAWRNGTQKRWADHVVDTCEYIIEFSGKIPWLYSNNNDYTANLRRDSRLQKYPLWITWPVPSAKDPLSPAPWTCWQYSWSGKVAWSDASIDQNVYYSDVGQLHEDVGRTLKPPEPPVENDLDTFEVGYKVAMQEVQIHAQEREENYGNS